MTTEPQRNRLDRVREVTSWASLGGLLVLGVGFVVLCFRTAPTPDDVSLNLAIFGSSLLFGLLAGFLMTPGTAREESQFGVAARAISTFASGYLLAKTDALMNAVLAPKLVLESSSVLPAFRIVMSIGIFIAFFLYIYILRVYVLKWISEQKGDPLHSRE